MIHRFDAKGVRPDGPRIRELRRQAGLSQRAFSERCAVTMRTLQRAESGVPILPEMLNAIASGLKVTAAALVLDSPEAGPAPRVEPHKEHVRLRRTASAREITEVLGQVREVAFEYDIDPDESTAEILAEATEIVEQLTKRTEPIRSDPANVVRRLGRLNRLLAQLDERGSAFFVGTYWEPTVTIEDEPGPRGKPQYCRIERICRGLLRISRAKGRYQTRLVAHTYTDEQLDRSADELRRYGWVVEDLRGYAAPTPVA